MGFWNNLKEKAKNAVSAVASTSAYTFAKKQVSDVYEGSRDVVQDVTKYFSEDKPKEKKTWEIIRDGETYTQQHAPQQPAVSEKKTQILTREEMNLPKAKTLEQEVQERYDKATFDNEGNMVGAKKNLVGKLEQNLEGTHQTPSGTVIQPQTPSKSRIQRALDYAGSVIDFYKSKKVSGPGETTVDMPAISDEDWQKKADILYVETEETKPVAPVAVTSGKIRLTPTKNMTKVKARMTRETSEALHKDYTIAHASHHFDSYLESKGQEHVLDGSHEVLLKELRHQYDSAKNNSKSFGAYVVDIVKDAIYVRGNKTIEYGVSQDIVANSYNRSAENEDSLRTGITLRRIAPAHPHDIAFVTDFGTLHMEALENILSASRMQEVRAYVHEKEFAHKFEQKIWGNDKHFAVNDYVKVPESIKTEIAQRELRKAAYATVEPQEKKYSQL